MYVIIDRCADDGVLSALAKMNINIIKSFDLDYLYKPVNTHPDLQIHFVDKTTAVAAPVAYGYYKAALPRHIELIKGEKNPGETYPHDCAYNIARVGNNVIGNMRYADGVLTEIYSRRGFCFIDVKQGYTKCNLCIIDENAAVTEDEGLYKRLSANGINVLKLQYGGVALKGFDYGFIGGASGLIGKNKIAFAGDIRRHSQYEDIKNFLALNKVDIISLLETKLQDCGSLMFFE